MLSELKEAILHYIPVFPIVLFVLSRYKMKIYDLKLYSTGRVYEGNGDSNLHFLACVVYTFLITGMVSAAGIPSVIDFGFGINYLNFNFIPFGFMLPIMWNEFESFKKTVEAGFLFSLFIEITQMFNFRATDVDDLMMNTLGTVIGFGIYYILFVKIFKNKSGNDSFRSKLRMGSSYKSVFYSGSEYVDLTVLTIVSYAIIGSLVRNYCFLFI
ncbi:VanZ family protein [Peptoclostridium sp. AF21-18]|uniref:VanZ family protein n=1 Tax=Peptoclostridium sp. AF21-18 TaxID=2292243 RepID=UPI000E507EEA|nr:VanZ family protein [Peptoclostridium sp. AF21-18]RHQ97741.1 VanZ family protein [Peptoclostridium sp. AF21-18]